MHKYLFAHREIIQIHFYPYVAIQTRYIKLRDFIKKSIDIKNFISSIGNVKYGEYDKTNPHDGSSLFYKRRLFSHEKEVRVVIYDIEVALNYLSSFGKKEKKLPNKIKNGRWFGTNLDDLIESVYISPNASKEFKKEVTDLIKKHKISAKVIDSCLDTPLLYVK